MLVPTHILLPWTLAAYAMLGCIACMGWKAPWRALLLFAVATSQALVQSRFLPEDAVTGLMTPLGFAAFPLLSGGIAALLAGGGTGADDPAAG